MDFSDALLALKSGSRVSHTEWDKNVWIEMYTNSSGVSFIQMLMENGLKIKEWVPATAHLFSNEFYIV